ncbi:heme o synthase [Halobacillus sp. ACCC02827]|uniref:heme o synthase n=1 Tax=Bacillaceae TaxID=186817 RepID=UPI0002A4DD2D|nr:MULTISPECIES: heme o synthase [Bacillaceae]ELK44941.1 protoheme IX farnesyltransferase [Halobacillus sp. BAB-2008]QHT47033.1 protoheme IX farnesyltransferase [Bacillus sp. SB49]WJE14258.1 heme o synthase [Halobacillus sp. ACCC02827]
MEREDIRTTEKQPLTDILAKTVKTGIIKSNLVPMFAGLTLALYTYEYGLLEKLPEIIFALIGSIMVMGAAGAFNNWYDRDIDAIMERTKTRPTVTGQIKPRQVLWLASLMAVLGVIILSLATPLAGFLGFLGLFFYVVPYTMWTKRRTIYNTEVGSLSGATPPLIGWAAIYPDITHPAILGLFVIALIWQMPHFYSIAIRKQEEYTAAKIPMLPVVKGARRTYIQTNIYLVILIGTSFLLGTLSLGLLLVSLLLGIGWLVLSLYGYRKMDSEKWAKYMFIYSLIHMTVLFTTVIIYSLMGVLFGL